MSPRPAARQGEPQALVLRSVKTESPPKHRSRRLQNDIGKPGGERCEHRMLGAWTAAVVMDDEGVVLMPKRAQQPGRLGRIAMGEQMESDCHRKQSVSSLKASGVSDPLYADAGSKISARFAPRL